MRIVFVLTGSKTVPAGLAGGSHLLGVYSAANPDDFIPRNYSSTHCGILSAITDHECSHLTPLPTCLQLY